MTIPEDPNHERRSPVAPGDRVGHFEIIEEIAHGGMGIVFRARDLNLPRDVALKCPWPEIAQNSEMRNRFLREGRIDSRLSHPNIVHFYEVFESNGLPWLAMEYVDGESLERTLAESGRLDVDRVIELAIGMVKGLSYAHELDILHRDVNPRNVLISRTDRALLTDFGLARFVVSPEAGPEESTEPTAHTTTGRVMGTRPYMSPEQLRGKPLEKTSDIFSFGVLLYEVVTGTKPFQGTPEHSLLEAILNLEPEPVSRYTYDCPPELERIIRKCLSKRPDERYQDARDLLVDLRALHRERQSSISSVSAEPAPAPAPLSRAPWWILGGVVLAVAVLAVWQLTKRSDGPIPMGDPLQITAGAGWEGEPAVSPDGSQIAYVADVSGNKDIFVVGANGGQALQITHDPASDETPVWFPDGRHLAFVSHRNGRYGTYKVSCLGGPVTLLMAEAGHAAISPLGTEMVFIRADENGRDQIEILSLDNPDEIRSVTNAGDDVWIRWHPAWSPDGRSLCYSSRNSLHLIDLRDASSRVLTTGGVDLNPAWSPKGDAIYFSSIRRGTTSMWRTTLDGPPVRLTHGAATETHPSISRDGSTLVYSTLIDNYDVAITDLESGDQTVLPGSRSDWMPTIAPDRSAVVFTSNRVGETWELWIQDLNDLEPVGDPRRLTEHEGVASHPAVSPDGSMIAYYRIIDGQRDVWIIPRAGGVPVQITADPASDSHPDWSPDGRELVFESDRGGASRIWIVAVDKDGPSGAPRAVTPPEHQAHAPRWSPRGDEVAYVSFADEEESIWITTLADESNRRLTTSKLSSARVQWAPDGTRLYVSTRGGGDPSRLHLLDVASGEDLPLEHPVTFGFDSVYLNFDLSADGRALVHTRRDLSGDIWAFKGEPGTF